MADESVRVKTDWSAAYGERADRFDLDRGDVWEVGPHLMAVGDLEDGDAAVFLDFAGEKPEAIITDPPWGAGNARSFRTKAMVDGDRGRPVDWTRFQESLLEIFARCSGPVFVEFGIKPEARLVELAEKFHGTFLARWNIVYYHKHPCVFLLFSFGGDFTVNGNPTGMDESDATRWALEQAKAIGCRNVFDPCMGRGQTAVLANKVGLPTLGMELNPRRMSVTLSRLADKGLTVARRGNFL